MQTLPDQFRRIGLIRLAQTLLLALGLALVAGTVVVADGPVTYNGCEALASGAIRLLNNTSLTPPFNNCITAGVIQQYHLSPSLTEVGVSWTNIGPQGVIQNGTTPQSASMSITGSAAAGSFCLGGDCRTSWNNQDANSVTPVPRNCPPGQVAVSTGSYSWQCGQASGFNGNLSGDVSGGQGSTTVVAINGSPLGNLSEAATGQVLTWNGSQWQPASVSSASAGTTVATGLHLSQGSFGLQGPLQSSWMTIVSANSLNIPKTDMTLLITGQVQIYGEQNVSLDNTIYCAAFVDGNQIGSANLPAVGVGFYSASLTLPSGSGALTNPSIPIVVSTSGLAVGSHSVDLRCFDTVPGQGAFTGTASINVIAMS